MTAPVIRHLWIPVSALIVAAGAQPLFADQDWTGPLGRRTTFYGQLSPSVVAADDGFGSRTVAADAAQSVSRIGFRSPLQGTIRSFRFETSLGLRQSNQFSQTTTAPTFDLTKGDIRWLELSWAYFGGRKLSIGQGSMATDNVATSDLSGTDVVTGVSVPDMAGGFVFRTSAGVLSGITVKSAFKTFDGIRRTRARYDTPVGRGLTLSVAAGAGFFQDFYTNQVYDLALSYDRNEGNYRMVGAIGASMTRQNGQPNVYETVGSISALHKPSGWNITFSGGFANPGGRGAYAKLGRALNLVSWGSTSVSVDVLVNRDSVSNGSISRAWGGAIVQRIEARSLDLFVGVRRFDLRNTVSGDLHPVRAAQLGARWRF